MSRTIKIENADLMAKVERQTRKNGRSCGICPKRNSYGWCPIIGGLRPRDAKPCKYGDRLIINASIAKSKARRK